MATTGKRPPSGSSANRRRRPAPTIELKATEVPPEIATAAAEQPVIPEVERVAAAPEPPPPEPPPPFEPPPPPPNGPGTESDEPSGGRGVAWLPPDIPWPMVTAGAVGGATALIVALLIWLAVPRSDPSATLAPRLAAIENQVRDLAARATSSAVDPKSIETLSARLAKAESALAAPAQPATDAALARRVAALEYAVKPISDTVAALARRNEELDAAIREARGRADAANKQLAEVQSVTRTSTVDHGEIAKLSSRVTALEKTDHAVADELAKRAAAPSDGPVRLAVAAAALRSAIDRGDPFGAELATLRPLTEDTAALAALEPFAAAGVPRAPALARQLAGVIPAMRRIAGNEPRDSGFFDRLQANAEKLVRIRPTEAVPGDDPAATLSRVEARAAHADIAGALAELAKLPPAVRAPAIDWIAKAEARDKALDAGRRLAAEAIAALKITP